MVVHNKTRKVLLLIVCWAHGLVGPLFARLPLLINNWYGSRNNYRGYHPSIVLYDLLPYWDPVRVEGLLTLGALEG